MIDFMYMVRNTITELFTTQVGKWQGDIGEDGKPSERKALLIHFRVEKARVQMLIHAPMNYVGVYTRKAGDGWVEWAKEKGRFECVSYHDSCWREGVEHFLHEHHEHISFCPFPIREGWNIIKSLTDAIHVVKLDEIQLDGLAQIRKKKYG